MMRLKQFKTNRYVISKNPYYLETSNFEGFDIDTLAEFKLAQLMYKFKKILMTGKVYITDYIVFPDIEKKILKSLSVKKTNDIEILLVWNQVIDESYLKQFPKLKAIVRYGVGFDKINKKDIEKRNLIVCNTPDYASDEVSDTALAYLMMITRGVLKYDNDSRKNFNQWKFNTTINQIKRSSKVTVGVIGAGRIGSKFIKKTVLCGFNTIYYDPYLKRNANSERDTLI